MTPETRYARSGDVNIAFQVFGEGPVDLVYVPGWVSNVELIWDDPYLSRFFRRLSSFARVITFDKRGTGLSDPVSVDNLPDLETRMDDVRAVMDEVGSDKATIFGHSEGGFMEGGARGQAGVLQTPDGRRFLWISERNGSSRPAICGAAYSIAPSAVFSRPVRDPSIKGPWLSFNRMIIIKAVSTQSLPWF